MAAWQFEGMTGRRQFLAIAGAGALGLMGRGARAEEVQIAALIDQAPQTHALIPALRMAMKSLDAAKALTDYEATLTKTEQVGREILTAKLQLKVRHSPYSVYIKYLEPSAGREAIYVTGRNQGLVAVHGTGLQALVGTLNIDPLGSTAMAENRYPITKAGMVVMTESLMEQWITLAKGEAAGVTVNNYPNAKIGTQACQTIEVVLAQPIGSSSYQTSRLYVDSASGLPIRVQQYAFPTRRGQKPVLVEDYLYQNLKTNIGLAEIDFDPANPKYGY